MVKSINKTIVVPIDGSENALKVLEYAKVCPVWMVKGAAKNKEVLLAVDNSENSMRAVGHAGFFLAGTDVKVTLFHSKRDLRRYVPAELLEEFPGFQKFWQKKPQMRSPRT